MPIEDLDFLYKNSVKENIIVLIDSNKRDQNIWNEPNDFQIDFVEPFKFIYGIDVLDVTIPRTMYSIETYNNSLSFKIGYGDVNDTNQYVTLSVDERDYTISEFLDELNSILNVHNISAEVPITKVSENRKSILMFSNNENPPRPFVFNMMHSGIADNMGFNRVASSKHSNSYRKIDSNENLFASVPQNVEKFQIDYMHSPGTILRSFRRIQFHDNPKPIDFDLEDIEDAQIFSDASAVINIGQMVSFFLNGITLVDNDLTLENEPFAIYELDLSHVETVNERNMKISTFENSMLVNLTQENMYNIGNVSGINADNITLLTTKPDLYKFDSSNRFHVDEDKSEYTFDLIPIKNRGNVIHYIYSPKLTAKNIVYDVTYISSFELRSTGIIQLYGERYVTIHCDNIENHLRGSMMFNSYSPGLALINLGVQGYSQSRNDFYGVAYKEFHPIGKLNHLRFTVRRSDGKLYDFKNVNWHMLISVKYYVMKNVRNFTTSILNPNYNINFLEYQTNSQSIKNNEDMTDSSSEYESDDNIDDLQFRDEYLTQERKLKQDYSRYYSDEAESD